MLKHPAPPSMNPPQVTCDEINVSSDDDSSTVSNDVSKDASMHLDESNYSLSNSASLFVTLSKSKIARMEKKCEVHDKIKNMFKTLHAPHSLHP